MRVNSSKNGYAVQKINETLEELNIPRLAMNYIATIRKL